MKQTLLRTMFLVTLLSVTLAAAARSKGAVAAHGNSASDVPLVLFQSIDRRLTQLDADSQKLRLSMHEILRVRGPASRQEMVRQLQRSRSERERLRTVNQLLAISSRAERRYRNRRQAYGAALFRDLRARVFPVRAALLRAHTAQTLGAWAHEENIVNTRLLSVITQFQAISGGYVALACHQGSWACCHPRTLQNGKSTVRGCTWSCTSKLAACRGGCLGRRTPGNVIAVRNTPKPPIFAQPSTLASRQTRKFKPKAHVNSPEITRSSAAGR